MFVIVENWSGEIFMGGQRIYTNEFSAKKAIGYFLKDEADDYTIVELPYPLMKALVEMKKDPQ